MKLHKRILAVFLSCVMSLGTCMVSFAEEIEYTSEPENVEETELEQSTDLLTESDLVEELEALEILGTSQSGEYGTFIDGEQVIADMIEKNGENVHPRLIMTDDKFAQLRSHIGDGSVTATVLEELRGEVNNYLNEDVTKITDYNGNTLEIAKRIQRYVAALSLAYNIFGDEEYAKRAYKELEVACSFNNWNPYHFLDTGEMCIAFAYGYDWLYDWMTPKQRTYIRTNLIEKGLNQVMEDYTGHYTNTPDKDGKYRSYYWYGSSKGDNWQFVCTGGANLAALAIGDEADARDVCEKVLTYSYKKAYTAVRQGYSIVDGTYVEGLGYWDYATYNLGLISSALITTTGTDYGLTDYEGIRKSAEFVYYMSSNYPRSFSFGDDNDSTETWWPVFLWLGQLYNSKELSTIRLKHITDDNQFRYLDVLWVGDGIKDESANDNATDWGSVGASNASFRNSWERSGLVAALHVGLNDYKYHGHYDLGSFYIEANGSRFFTDLGNENYKLENREFSYRIKPEGHNTLVINPTSGTDQVNGANCLVTEYASGNEAYAISDLTQAYAQNGAKSVVRGLKMIKDKECVVVQDEISLNKAGEIYWFAHTKGTISIASDGRSAIITVDNNRLWVGILSEGGKFTEMKPVRLETSKNVPGVKDNEGYTKLAIHLTNTMDTTITVACIPLKSGQSKPSWTPTVKALSEWKNGNGTTPEKLTGWQTIGGKKYYYGTDGVMVTGWQTINGKKYYFGTDGVTRTGLQTISSKLYGFGSDGEMLTGLQTFNNKKYFFGTDNGVAITGWKTISNNKYYFGSDYAAKTGTETIEGKTYEFDSNGILVKEYASKNGIISEDGKIYYYIDDVRQTGLKTVNSKLYYFGTDYAAVIGWKTVSGNKYYFGSDGAALKGWQTIANRRYYLGTDGVTRTGLQIIDNKTYGFGTDGKMLTGWQTFDNKRYYFGTNDGMALTGWQTISDKRYYLGKDGVMVTGTVTIDGKTYQFDSDGVFVKEIVEEQPVKKNGLITEAGKRYYYVDDVKQTGWQTIDNQKYYFGDDGSMMFGWVKVDGAWYFLDATGVMATDWVKSGGAWYYLKSDGTMAKGWLKYKGAWYYFKSDGAMATGWVSYKDNWYYLKANGAMATGWVSDRNNWYYLKSDGTMATGWVKYNNKWYYMNPQKGGVMATGWILYKANWYYFGSDGAMVTGKQVINNKVYNFNSSGVWVN